MSTSPPARRNSSKPFIDPNCLKNGDLQKFKNGQNEPNLPNVMTSPAMFPVDYKNLPHLNDIEEDSFSASSVTDIPRPPDGGWGWFVVFASFMIHVLGKKMHLYASLENPFISHKPFRVKKVQNSHKRCSKICNLFLGLR